MTNASPICSAVVGGGFIGTVHVEALRRMGVEVVGVLASSPESGAKRARHLGIPTAYPDIDALLGDARVQVVHVASPNELHHPIVRAVLEAGKHVVCEKPLAVTSAESAELVALAASAGLVAAVNFNLRYYPLNLHAADFVRSGGIGTVRLVTGRYLQDWLLYDTDWNWRLEVERGGALRAVGDIGSHWLDLMAFITGLPIESVMADLATFVRVRQRPTHPIETFGKAGDGATEPVEMRTEDAATVLLRFAGGARGSVAISQLSAGRRNTLEFEIDGSSAAIAWSSEQAEQLWIGHRDRPNEVLLRDRALMSEAAQAAARLPAGHAEGFADTFAALFRAIYADISAGSPSPSPRYPTFADGHDAMLVGDAVAASARTGTWADVVREAVPSAAR